jgi:hypothetical protein
MTDSSGTDREDLPNGDRNAASNAADAPDNARNDDSSKDESSAGAGDADPTGAGADTDVHGEPENPAG